MSAPDDTVTPEEKLLKVIQAGGRAPEAGPRPAASAPPRLTPVAPMSRPAGPAPGPRAVPPKQKLKVGVAAAARPSELGPAAPAKPAAAAADSLRPAASAMPRLIGHAPRVIGGGGPVAVRKRPHRASLGIRAVSKALVAAAVVVVLLLGWDVWVRAGAAQPPPSLVPIPETAPDTDAAPTLQEAEPPVSSPIPGLVPLDDLLKMYAQRNPFGQPVAAPPPTGGPGTNAPPSDAAQMPWANYAKANLKLKGLSRLPGGDMEAIVADSKTGKLLFLRKGDDFLLERQPLRVESIGNDGVMIGDGTRKTLLK